VREQIDSVRAPWAVRRCCTDSATVRRRACLYALDLPSTYRSAWTWWAICGNGILRSTWRGETIQTEGLSSWLDRSRAGTTQLARCNQMAVTWDTMSSRWRHSDITGTAARGL